MIDVLFLPLAFFAGTLLAVQAGANAQLAKATASPFAATTLQLSVGTLLLLAVAIATGSLVALENLPHVTWWHVLGGTASAFYVVSTILLFPRLGAVVSVGLFIAGQMIASLALDAFGLLGVPATGLRPMAVAAILLVLAGAGLVVFGQRDATKSMSASRFGWLLLAVAAGAVLPVQGAVNALLRSDLGGAAFPVGVISFLVATFAMAAVLLATLVWPQTPRPQLGGVSAMPWWGWLGGFAGATYVTTVFTSIPVIGAATTIGLTIAGQQLASILVDRYGWFRLPQRPVSAMRLAGVVLILAGAGALKLALA
ncbi:DMT family transporter [Afipia sp. DC4300-2b1]|uniref:DMT family transporter n=1 Tax=Afipia sp. DC4300-2b1 TaxID=2804672 RepID=UPI003CF4D998